MSRSSLNQNKSVQSHVNVGHEERPVWREHKRTIDDPAANFQRLRGQWSRPKSNQMRKGGVF